MYGPQKQEAWESGEAVQTGDLEFDLAFNVVSTVKEATPDKHSVRGIAPVIRATFLRHRDHVRDVEVDNEGVVLGGYALGRSGKPPNASDVKDLFSRGLELACDLENAASKAETTGPLENPRHG